MLKVGLIGLGAIGRVHFDCWRKCPDAQLVAISARDPKKLAGEWGAQEFNLGDQTATRVDLSGVATYREAVDLIHDPNVDAVDICLPTSHHAPLSIAALRAGKHVLCEKPMARTVEECTAMIEAARQSARRLMVGHCLRYWPHYLKVKELLAGGSYGRPLHAAFHRSSALPQWSADGWLMRPAESGGVILDMHIHDVDVGLWWFGEPDAIQARGAVQNELALTVDALWDYASGPTVHFHSAWDPNGGEFRHAFSVILERATLSYDLATEAGALRLTEKGKVTAIPLPEPGAHQAEINDFAAAIVHRRGTDRVPPAESSRAVAIALEELRQVQAGRNR
jgi:predicted dehydrogenase